MTGRRWLVGGVVVAAGLLPGEPAAAQLPTLPPGTRFRDDPPTAPRTGIFRAPEWPHGRARPGTLPGVPDYPYTTNPAPRPTVAVLSLVRVPAGRLASADPLPPGTQPPQVYQLPAERMQADHCFLSRVAVALHDDGSYQVSFRADQNPLPGPGSPAPTVDAPRYTLQTGELRRNLFLVRVRGYASYPTDGRDRLGPVVPKPALWELAVDPFWVQRGEPYSGYVPGRSEAVRRYFEYIDRVEVEFTYR